MNQTTEMKDSRTAFFRKHFEKGLAYQAYVATGTESQKQRWHDYEGRIRLQPAQTELLRSFKRGLNVLVLSGIWCGDCMRQGPMLRAIEEAAPVVAFRYLDNNTHPELRDELRICGGARVPVVVACSEDFFELARFGDRTLSAYRRKAKQELGPACETGFVPPPEEDLAAELDEWVRHFERLQLMLRLSPFLRNRYRD